MQSPVFQIEEESPWVDLGNGVQRQVFGYDDRIMLVKVKFEAGARGELHNHFHSQVTHVHSGLFEVYIGENKRTIKAGDGFYVSPDEVHGVLCIEAGILVDVFSPCRQDFL